MRRWMWTLALAACMDRDDDGFRARNDCDDQDPGRNPGARDVPYDGLDQDCDGHDQIDVDGDGYVGLDAGGDDCDDRDRRAHPGAEETWYDGIDADCDGQCDYDQDGDGAVLVGTALQDGSPCDRGEGEHVYADEDCDDTDPLLVERGIDSSVDGGEDHDPTEPLYVLVRQQASPPVIELATAAGQPVPFELEQHDEIYVLWPQGPLAPDTEHQLTVTDPCVTRVMRFRTAPAQQIDLQSLAGRTWRIAIEGMGLWYLSPLDPYLHLSVEPAFLAVTAVSGESFDLRLAASAYGVGGQVVQDPCVPTVELSGVELAHGSGLWLHGIDLPMTFGELPVMLGDASLGGIVGADRWSLWFRGLADVRPLAAEEDLCASAAAQGEPCVPCPDGSGDSCLSTNIYSGLPAILDEISLVPRTQADIDADPSCS